MARLGRRRWVPFALLFLGGVVISGFTMLRGIDPFDEGLVLQAARRVSDGEVPYADFLWSYGPAWPYLLGGLFDAFGVSLLPWRVLRVLADAGVALVVFALLRRLGVEQRVALLGWLAAACAMAQPRSANPFPYALLLALLAIYAVSIESPSRRRLFGTAAITACTAAFRLDFAVYAGAAVVTVIALFEERARLRSALTYAAATAAMTLLVYAPFLIDVGPQRLYDSLVGTSLRERGFWTLSFPLGYDGRLSPSPHAVKDLLDFYQPLLLVLGLATVALAIALRRRAAWAGLAVFALGALSYLLSRTDEFHTQPLFVALAVLLPLTVAAANGRRRRDPLAVAAAVVFSLLLAHAGANRLSALFQPEELSTVDVAAADGAQAPPKDARSLERVVATVHERVPPGEPIYVAPQRSDLVTYTNPMVYVLTDRDNAGGRDFGLLTSAKAQRTIVARLERARPRVVVRWTDPLSSEREPNQRGRSSGVRVVDDYLARDYRLLERLHHYDLLVPRE